MRYEMKIVWKGNLIRDIPTILGWPKVPKKGWAGMSDRDWPFGWKPIIIETENGFVDDDWEELVIEGYGG